MIILIYQSAILSNFAPGNRLASINLYGGRNLDNFKDTADFPESEKSDSEKQDTLKFKTAASEKIISDLPSDLIIQAGAFIHENNALALKLRLSGLLNQKVSINPENKYFKVRITGCKTFEEMGKLVESLGLLGIRNVWIFHNLQIDDSEIRDSLNLNSLIKASLDNIPVPLVSDYIEPGLLLQFNLQVGVFHSKAQAKRAQRRITSKLNLPVKIVREWEYYIVFITGFKNREEIFMYYPKLAALGYNESFIVEKQIQNHR